METSDIDKKLQKLKDEIGCLLKEKQNERWHCNSISNYGHYRYMKKLEDKIWEKQEEYLQLKQIRAKL